MADVELVIKISEKNYEHIKRLGAMWIETEKGLSTVSKALLNGTPLPKGHGRLIDGDVLYDQYRYADYDFDKTMEYAPTIIEADKAESEEYANEWIGYSR